MNRALLVGHAPWSNLHEFTIAFANRPEVQAFQTYLSSDTWANAKAAISQGWVSANKNADPANFKNPIDKLSVEIIQDPNAVTRFDASDLMPGAVNTEFWRQMTDWITGKSTKSALDAIEASWPPTIRARHAWKPWAVAGARSVALRDRAANTPTAPR